MSKPLKVLGTIAGAVALVGLTISTAGIGGAAFAAAAGSIGTIAGIVSAVANIGSQALIKPPPARGSVSQILIAPDAPQPYCMGEGYFAGVLRHDTGYGATLKKVPNPYRFMPVVYSGGGPVQSISPRVDYATVGSWYSTFLFTTTKLGATPETALVPQWSGAPGWNTASKLSGQAAIGWSFLFDKDGKRFASGIPLIGAYGQWVKVYDPRLDDTHPGGSGAHRLGNEATYTYSANPALHAGTYAYGRYQNGKRTLGMGLPADAIDWAVIAAWANVCDANAWTMFGVLYEPGDRWANLKDICIAGGAEPVAGGVLSFKYSAPTVALDTITEADLTDAAATVTAMQSFRDRVNTIVPKYRSPEHNWEMVDAEPVVVSTFMTEDGEEKREVWPFNFVKSAAQATQLAAYKAWDSRELAPITLTCNPRMRYYRPGETLQIDLPELGLDTLATIQKRTIDPVTMEVTLELIGETTAKHAYALGLTGTPPPTPALGQTNEERDELAAAAILGTVAQLNVRAAAIKNPRNLSDSPISLLKATALPANINITVARHDWDYPDAGTVTRELDALVNTLDDGVSNIPEVTTVYVYFDDDTLADTAPDYKVTTDESVALNSAANPGRHSVGAITTPAYGSGSDFEQNRNVGYGFFIP